METFAPAAEHSEMHLLQPIQESVVKISPLLNRAIKNSLESSAVFLFKAGKNQSLIQMHKIQLLSVAGNAGKTAEITAKNAHKIIKTIYVFKIFCT